MKEICQGKVEGIQNAVYTLSLKRYDNYNNAALIVK